MTVHCFTQQGTNNGNRYLCQLCCSFDPIISNLAEHRNRVFKAHGKWVCYTNSCLSRWKGKVTVIKLEHWHGNLEAVAKIPPIDFKDKDLAVVCAGIFQMFISHLMQTFPTKCLLNVFNLIIPAGSKQLKGTKLPKAYLGKQAYANGLPLVKMIWEEKCLS